VFDDWTATVVCIIATKIPCLSTLLKAASLPCQGNTEEKQFEITPRVLQKHEGTTEFFLSNNFGYLPSNATKFSRDV
jgi:hypothetical protein